MKNIAHNILSIDDRIFTSFYVIINRDSIYYYGDNREQLVTAQDTMRGNTFYVYISAGLAMKTATRTDKLPHHYFHSFKTL